MILKAWLQVQGMCSDALQAASTLQCLATCVSERICPWGKAPAMGKDPAVGHYMARNSSVGGWGALLGCVESSVGHIPTGFMPVHLAVSTLHIAERSVEHRSARGLGQGML